MEPIFKDEQLNQTFLEQGFVTIPFLSAEQVAEIEAFYRAQTFDKVGEFYITIWKDEPLHRRMVHDYLWQQLQAKSAELLNEYQPIVCSFAVKTSGVESAWAAHQDDTFVEESKFSSLSIWIPLCDTDSSNGAMRVLPESHRQYTDVRSPGIPKQFDDSSAEITEKMVTLNLKAGEALVFDHRLIHASGSNVSGRERVAFVAVLIPQKADLIYLYFDQERTPPYLKHYIISPSYYLEAPLGVYSREPNDARFQFIKEEPFEPLLPTKQTKS